MHLLFSTAVLETKINRHEKKLGMNVHCFSDQNKMQSSIVVIKWSMHRIVSSKQMTTILDCSLKERKCVNQNLEPWNWPIIKIYWDYFLKLFSKNPMFKSTPCIGNAINFANRKHQLRIVHFILRIIYTSFKTVHFKKFNEWLIIGLFNYALSTPVLYLRMDWITWVVNLKGYWRKRHWNVLLGQMA
jgi:hypothetical protein